jgi:hypothetical protein
MDIPAVPTTTKGSTPPPATKPPATTTASTVKEPSTLAKTTSDIKPTTTARKTSLSDLEKELQEFDIDLDKDDVSDAETGPSTGASKKFADEDEVKT